VACYNSGMKKEMMEILACPVCKANLKLTVKKEKDNEVIGGSLLCKKCGVTYPIEDSIPVMLPPDAVN